MNQAFMYDAVHMPSGKFGSGQLRESAVLRSGLDDRQEVHPNWMQDDSGCLEKACQYRQKHEIEQMGFGDASSWLLARTRGHGCPVSRGKSGSCAVGFKCCRFEPVTCPVILRTCTASPMNRRPCNAAMDRPPALRERAADQGGD
jgi:hypothetical protein